MKMLILNNILPYLSMSSKLLLVRLYSVVKWYNNNYEKELQNLKLLSLSIELKISFLNFFSTRKQELEEQESRLIKVQQDYELMQEKVLLISRIKKDFYDNRPTSLAPYKRAAEYIALSRWPLWTFFLAKKKIISYYSNKIPRRAFAPSVIKSLSLIIYRGILDEELNRVKAGYKKSSAELLNFAVEEVKASLLSLAGLRISIFKKEAIDNLLNRAKEDYKNKNKNHLLKSAKDKYTKELRAAKKLLESAILRKNKKAAIEAAEKGIQDKKSSWYKITVAFLKKFWHRFTIPSSVVEIKLLSILKKLDFVESDKECTEGINLADESQKINDTLQKVSSNNIENLEKPKLNDIKVFIGKDKDSFPIGEADCIGEILEEMTEVGKMDKTTVDYIDGASAYKEIVALSMNMPFQNSNSYWEAQAELRMKMAELLYSIDNYDHAKLCIIAAAYIIAHNCSSVKIEIKKRILNFIFNKFPEMLKKRPDYFDTIKSLKPIINNALVIHNGKDFGDFNFSFYREPLRESLNDVLYKGFDWVANFWEGFKEDEIRYNSLAVSIKAEAAGPLKSFLGSSFNFSSAEFTRLHKMIEEAMRCYDMEDHVGFLKKLQIEYIDEKQCEKTMLQLSFFTERDPENLRNSISYWDVNSENVINHLLQNGFNPSYIARLLYIISMVVLYSDKVKCGDRAIKYIRAKEILSSIVTARKDNSQDLPKYENNQLLVRAKRLGGNYLAELQEIQKLALEEKIMIDIMYTGKSAKFDEAQDAFAQLKKINNDSEPRSSIKLIESIFDLLGVSDLASKSRPCTENNELLEPTRSTCMLPNGDIFSLTFIEDPLMNIDGIKEMLTNHDSHLEEFMSDMSNSLILKELVLESKVESLFFELTLRERYVRLQTRYIEENQGLRKLLSCKFIDKKFLLLKSAEDLEEIIQNKNKKISSSKVSVVTRRENIKKFCISKDARNEYIGKIISGNVSIGINVLNLFAQSIENKALYVWHYVSTLKRLVLGYCSDASSDISTGFHVMRDGSGKFISLKFSDIRKIYEVNSKQEDSFVSKSKAFIGNCLFKGKQIAHQYLVGGADTFAASSEFSSSREQQPLSRAAEEGEDIVDSLSPDMI